MKKWIYISIVIVVISVISIFLLTSKNELIDISIEKKEITYVINDQKPNLLDGVIGKKNDVIVEITADDSLVNWNLPGKYTVNYLFNNNIVAYIKVIVVHNLPYIINHIDLISYIEDETLDYFATDIRAYDIHGKDITYDKDDNLRITIDDSLVDYEKVGKYNVVYTVIDDYGNVGKASIILTIKKNDPSPVIYGYEEPIYFKINTSFNVNDLLSGVEAYSSNGDNLTNFIIVDISNIDISNLGVQKAKYSITDNNIETTIYRDVVVIKDTEPLITGVKDYQIIDLGDLFVDFSLGVKAYDYTDKDITESLNIYFRFKNSDVLIDIEEFYSTYINEIGDYYIVYKSINSLEITSCLETYVKVFNDVTSPEINNTKDIVYPASLTPFDLLEGVVATKYYDDTLSVDLTDRLTIKILKNNEEVDLEALDFSKIDSYLIIYRVVDDSGNIKEVERKLYIIDQNEPVFYNIPHQFEYIISNSNEPNEIPNYKDGVVAWDLIDGDLSSQVAVVDNVNYLVPGEYYIEYHVSDKQGNEAVKIVTVNVVS